MFLYPTKTQVITPAKLAIPHRQLVIRDKNEPNLSAWLLLAKTSPKGLIVFAHGNAQNMGNHLASIYWLPAAGYHVLTFDYRGYGKSVGGKSLTGAATDLKRAVIYADKLRAALTSSKDTLPIYLYGQSLGASLAVYAASDPAIKQVLAKIVVESAFASYRQIFRQKAALTIPTALLAYPLSFSLPEDQSPLRHIAKLAPLPLLLVHSQSDSIVPIENSIQLYDQACEPKALWLYRDREHINIFTDKERRAELLGFLSSQTACH